MMKTKHNTKSNVLILLSSLILTLSCNKTKEYNLVYIFPEQEMTASDFIDQSRYVQLETTDACILSTIDAIRQYKDMIAILSDRKIFLFTSQGKFLTKIDRLGNGSEEYNTINDFQIYDDNVYVLSGIQNKLLEYTLEGSYKDTYALDDSYRHFVFTGKDRIVLSSEDNNDKHYNFVYYDLGERKVGASVDRFEKNQAYSFTKHNVFLNSDSSLLVCHPFDYSVYSLEGDQIIKEVEFAFDTPDQLPTGEKSYIEIDEETRYASVVRFLQAYSKIGNIRYLVYPLFGENGLKTCITRIEKDGTNRTVKIGKEKDDEFPYFFMGDFLSLQSDQLVLSVDASKLLELEKENNMSYFTESGLDDEDNPIIFFYSLKK